MKRSKRAASGGVPPAMAAISLGDSCVPAGTGTYVASTPMSFSFVNSWMLAFNGASSVPLWLCQYWIVPFLPVDLI